MRGCPDAEHEPLASAASPNGRNYAAETLSELNLALSFRPQKSPAGAYLSRPPLPAPALQLRGPAGVACAAAAGPAWLHSAVRARLVTLGLAVLVGQMEHKPHHGPVDSMVKRVSTRSGQVALLRTAPGHA